MLNRFRSSRPPVSRKRVYHDAPVAALGKVYYQQVAETLGVRAELVRAIAVIETAEKGLTEAGYPVIRFESHHWRKYRLASRAGQAFDKAKNSRDLDARWQQFAKMHAVDPVAAVLSHSFGWAQIMGFNHRACGFENEQNFLKAMRTIEGQGRAFVGFVQASPRLLQAMKTENLQQVAHHYNGKLYRRNRYDTKLANLLHGGGNAWA